MLTVNVTCAVCDGSNPCDECRAAGRALERAGFRVEHSSRAAALRAALAGTYGFDACIIPLDSNERSLADAAVALLENTAVALAVDDAAALPEDLPSRFRVFERSAFRAGSLPDGWPGDGARAHREVLPAHAARDDGEREHATRRLRPHATTKAVRTSTGAQRARARAVIDDEIAWCKASGARFALLAVRAGAAKEDIASKLIAASVRSADGIARDGAHLLIVLPFATRAGASAAAARLKKVLSADKRGPRDRAVIGIAAFPDDGSSASQLITKATKM
jgi:hypothetical protein